MPYFAYYRVSTETQAEKGGGLETQRHFVEKYCRENGIRLDKSFTDAGISGAIGDVEADEAIRKRPALVEMLANLQEGDTVIVLNTSRLWRSDVAKVIIRRELMKHRAKVIAVENPRFDLYAQNPTDRFMDAILESMDSWERETIALKLSKGRTTKAINGNKPAGMLPFGYRYSPDKKSVIVEEQEAKIVYEMFLAASRGTSLEKIAKQLNEAGIQPRKAQKWYGQTVRMILHNPFYVGYVQHQKKLYPGKHEAIISKVLAGKALAALDRRNKHKGKADVTPSKGGNADAAAQENNNSNASSTARESDA